jgi:hypothetical protein
MEKMMTTVEGWVTTVSDQTTDYKARKSHTTARVDFGMVDKKGRALGCMLIIEERVARPAVTTPHGTTYGEITAGFYTGVQATRAGSSFGASFPKMLRCETLEEAKASLLKRAAKSCKSAAKNAV